MGAGTGRAGGTDDLTSCACVVLTRARATTVLIDGISSVLPCEPDEGVRILKAEPRPLPCPYPWHRLAPADPYPWRLLCSPWKDWGRA